jgi:hypothetical protein
MDKNRAIVKQVQTVEYHYAEPIQGESEAGSDSEGWSNPLDYWQVWVVLALVLLYAFSQESKQPPVIINNQAPPPVIINNN